MDSINLRETMLTDIKKRPGWLKTKLAVGSSYNRIRDLNRRLGLQTVCEQAACPNIGICWDKLEVTYILLGKNCTRNCGFCNVSKNRPNAPDKDEPQSIALAIKELGLDFVVLTSVTRDDLADMGLSQFLNTINCIKRLSPDTRIEVLIPDFKNSRDLLKKISDSGADVIGHNIETVRGLYPRLRPSSNYDTSLEVLKNLKLFNSGVVTKSALLLGLGEEEDDVIKTISDLRESEVDILYIGQYLSPSKKHFSVKRLYSPDEFDFYADAARSLGFAVVVSQPLARSSWRAREAYEEWILTKQ